MWIRATFPDHRRRMYNSNVIAKITDKLVRSFGNFVYYFPTVKKKSLNSLANVKKTSRQR